MFCEKYILFRSCTLGEEHDTRRVKGNEHPYDGDKELQRTTSLPSGPVSFRDVTEDVDLSEPGGIGLLQLTE